MEARLQKIEEQVAFVERQMEELNGVVVDLSASLGTLGRRMDRLASVARRLEARVHADDTALRAGGEGGVNEEDGPGQGRDRGPAIGGRHDSEGRHGAG